MKPRLGSAWCRGDGEEGDVAAGVHSDATHWSVSQASWMLAGNGCSGARR